MAVPAALETARRQVGMSLPLNLTEQRVGGKASRCLKHEAIRHIGESEGTVLHRPEVANDVDIHARNW